MTAEAAKGGPAGQTGGGAAAASASSKDILTTYSYVFVWIGLSGLVIMINKYILSFAGMPYPIFLTLTHMALCALLAALLLFFKVTEPVKLDLDTYIKCVLPIAALFAGTLWMGNSAYLYLSVAFIQMIKALMPMMVFTMGLMFGTERYSNLYALNIAVVTCGVVIASYGELNFNLFGVMLQGGSLLTESTRLVLIQILLQARGIKLNPIHSLFYIAPACFVFLLVPFVFKELPSMLADDKLVIQPALLVGSALAAFALNVSVFLLIGKTSALTMNIAGVVKDWGLIFLSVLMFKSPVTLIQYGGYALSFVGVSWYNYNKLQAMKQQTSPTAPPISSSGATNGRHSSGGAADPERAPLLGK